MYAFELKAHVINDVIATNARCTKTAFHTIWLSLDLGGGYMFGVDEEDFTKSDMWMYTIAGRKRRCNNYSEQSLYGDDGMGDYWLLMLYKCTRSDSMQFSAWQNVLSFQVMMWVCVCMCVFDSAQFRVFECINLLHIHTYLYTLYVCVRSPLNFNWPVVVIHCKRQFEM